MQDRPCLRGKQVACSAPAITNDHHESCFGFDCTEVPYALNLSCQNLNNGVFDSTCTDTASKSQTPREYWIEATNRKHPLLPIISTLQFQEIMEKQKQLWSCLLLTPKLGVQHGSAHMAQADSPRPLITNAPNRCSDATTLKMKLAMMSVGPFCH